MFNRVSGVAVLLCVMVLILVVGCSSAPVSPQKPWVPISGNLVWVDSADIDTVYKAVLGTVKEMELSVIKQRQDHLSGVVVAKTSTGKQITIKLQAETAETTRVSIRVGFWADQKKARVIYSKIKKTLV